MILLICMAGFNTRFHDAGFDLPKYLLPWKEGVIIESILYNLSEKFKFDKIILLANQRDRYFQNELYSAVKTFEVSEEDIFFIPDTCGQAHTAAIGAEIICRSSAMSTQAIAIHNSDTIIIGREMEDICDSLLVDDIFVDVFTASSPKFSYVSLDQGLVTEIKEKQIISPFASSGFYAFKNSQYFLKLFNEFMLNFDKTKSELYMSDVVQFSIMQGAKVRANDLSIGSSTIVLGSPEEYGLEIARGALMR